MIRAIWTLELRLLLRQRLMLPALVIFTGIALWSVANGKSWYTYQRSGADSLAVVSASNLSKVKAELDTLTYTAERQDIETPFTLDWRLKPVAGKKLLPLAALSTGQADVLPIRKSARMTHPVFNNDLDEFRNPAQLMSGSFDLGFYVLFLFPLLFIALSYHVVSADREQGIWPLWQASAPQQQANIVLFRLLFRWMVALVPIIIALLYAFIWMKPQPGFTPAAFGSWSVFALLYTLMWLALGWLVVGRYWSSMQNVMALLAIWLLLLVVVPGLHNTLLESRGDADTRMEIASFRDVPERAWNQPMQVHQQVLKTKYPKLAADTSTEYNRTILQSCSYLSIVMEEEKKLHAHLAKDIRDKEQQQARLFWISPAAATMRAFTQMAGTTSAQHLSFEEQVLAYKQQRFWHMWDNMVLDSHYRAANLANMPQWKPAPLTESKQPWLPMLLWIAVPAAAAFFFSKKEQAT